MFTKTDIELLITRYNKWIDQQQIKENKPVVKREEIFLYLYRNNGGSQEVILEEWFPLEITETAILLASTSDIASEDCEITLIPLSTIDEIRCGA